MKRFTAISLSLVLALASLTACGSEPASNSSAPSSSESSSAESSSAETTESTASTESTEAPAEEEKVVYTGKPSVDYAPDWTTYNKLIADIYATTDFAEREKMMHEAEDMLMETGAILPLYYYNDIYMQKPNVKNIYSNLYGFKFFMFAETDKDTLNLNIASEPDKLDPALNTTVDGACLAVNSFAGLYTYGPDGKLQQDMASDTQVSEDGLTYTFTLLPDLKWSDGSELNANDFVYSWNRAAADETAADYSYMFDVIARNEDGTMKLTASEDGQTLTVELNNPCAYFLDLCAFPAYLPVKQAAVESVADWQEKPGLWASEAGFVSSGPYTLSEWKHNESMTYIKNPNYHRADEVKVETLQFMLSADDTAIFAAYNAGNLDFIDTVPNDEIQNLLDNPEFYIVDNLGTYYVSFNVKSPLFAGKTVEQANAMRRAFSLLVDREYIAENIGQTGQKPANTFVPAGMADGREGVFRANDEDYSYPDKENTGYFNPVYSEDNVAEARTLLESAGYKFDESGMLSAETPISFEYLVNEGTGNVAIGEALQQDFAAIGIDMTIKTNEWQVFLNERKAGNYDIARNGWLADFNDPINMLEMWESNSGNNDSQLGR